MDAYRQGVKDILVATDVASKGLDFTNIQHVINYDMPDDIENYGNHNLIYLSKQSVNNRTILMNF